MKIFITGGTGFIGKQVVNALKKKNHSLLLLSRGRGQKNTAKLKFLNGNLKNIKRWQDKFIKFAPDVVIHLAWEGLPDHHADISKKNLEGSLDLVQLAAKTECRLFIATGSGWEYGIQSGILAEDTVPIPFDAHTAAKHALNGLGWEIAKESGMSFVWMRLFFVYGPGQRPQALIPSLLTSIKAGKKPEIRNPNAQNDFVYVGDVAEAITLTVKKCFPKKNDSPQHYIYNVGSAKLTRVDYIVKYISKKLKFKGNYQKVAKQPQDRITYSYADITKIKKEIGWFPKTSIKRGIDLTITAFK